MIILWIFSLYDHIMVVITTTWVLTKICHKTLKISDFKESSQIVNVFISSHKVLNVLKMHTYNLEMFSNLKNVLNAACVCKFTLYMHGEHLSPFLHRW